MSYLSPTASAAFTQPNSVQQFASEYGLSPFQIPNSPDTGYTGADPNAPGQYMYVGPDGNVYVNNQPGQETPGTKPIGNYQAVAQQDPSPSAAAAGAESSLLNPSQIAGLAPQPYQSFGNVPTISPTNVDTSQMPGALSSFEQANATALAPTFQAQDMALQDNLGARGIVNSGAATYLNNELVEQQAGALAGADAPLIQQQQGAYNAAQSQNATAGNTASALNAGYYNNAVQGNQSAYNTFLGDLYGSGSQYGNNVVTGLTNTYAPANSQALTTLGQSPGQVGASYQTGLNSFNPAGFTAGTSAIEQGFTGSGRGGGGTNTYDLGGDNSIQNPGASVSWGG